MIYCKIANGVVVDRSIWDAAMPDDWPDYAEWVQNDEAQIGWLYDGATFTKADPPPQADE